MDKIVPYTIIRNTFDKLTALIADSLVISFSAKPAFEVDGEWDGGRENPLCGAG